jgi:hypothetical protein
MTRVADAHVSGELAQLAAALTASLSVDIERTHPLWCKGWLETYELQSPDVRELRAYIKEEYGGQTYRISVLNSAGAVLYSGKLDVAGQPKDQGRAITRDAWDPQAGAVKTGAADNGLGGGLVGKVIDMMRESTRDQMNAVKDMVTASRQETKDLIASIVQVRANENVQQSFASQLNGFVETTVAVDKVRKRLAPPAVAAPPPVAADDDLDPVLKEAQKAFAQKIVGSFMPQAAPAQPQQTAQQPASRQQRRPASGFRRRPVTAPTGAVEAETIPGFSTPAGHA